MDKSLSAKIDNLRIILCLGVIAIHSYISTPFVSSNWSITFLSKSLPLVCVPAFFFISGLLYGVRYNSSTSTQKFYLRRTSSLLVPYLLWNLIAFLVRLSVKHSFLSDYTSGSYNFESVWDAAISIFWTPELIPLWFLRNLFIFSISFPLLRYSIKKNRILTISILFLLDEFLSISGLFMFGLGTLIATTISQDSFSRFIGKSRWMLPLYLTVAIGVNSFTIEKTIISELLISASQIAGTFGLLAWIPSAKRYGSLSAAAIAFLYFSHGIVSPYITKGLDILIPADSSLLFLLQYMADFVLIVMVPYTGYLVLSHLCPRLTALLTGFRKKSARQQTTVL